MAVDLNASLASLRHLHEEVERSKQQIKELQKAQCEMDLEFEHHLEQHAMADCRQLVGMMHTKLPLELRELIYQYLYLEDGYIPVGSHHFTTYVPEPLRSWTNNPPTHSEPFIVIPEGATRQDHSIERDESVVYPDSRILDPAYLGYDVAREASIYYYKHNSFSVCTVEDTLANFLFRDHVYNFTTGKTTPESNVPLGTIPIDYIRSLEIRVKYEHYSIYIAYYKVLRNGEQDILTGLFDTMYDFSNRISPAIASQLHVDVCLMTSYGEEVSDRQMDENQRQQLNLFEAVRVPIYKLKHDLGADVKVTHYDENVRPFPTNLSGIFQLSKDQWSKEREAFEDAGVTYSPLDYCINLPGTNGMGFDAVLWERIMELRWGLDGAFDTRCSYEMNPFGRWPNTLRDPRSRR